MPLGDLKLRTARTEKCIRGGYQANGSLNIEPMLCKIGGQHVESWTNGVVWGRLIEEGWGAAAGFPGIVLEIDGDPVDVHIFESNDLPAHWHRLDLFEGEEYRRVPTIAKTRNGDIEVSIYEVIKPL